MRTPTLRLIRTALLGALLVPMLAPALAVAATGIFHTAILSIEHQWAHISYQLPKAKRADAFAALEKQAARLAGRYPDRAEPKLWEGIILSTEAGARGGLGALSLVRKARANLEAAEKINPDVMKGSVYTSLGSLYYQVPGWPLSFGSNAKAKKLLLKALAVNPDGIDPNYFYGDFLYRYGSKKAALVALEKALHAPARPEQPLADKGRRAQVRALIAKIKNGH